MSPILQVYRKYRISNADVRNIPPKFQTSDLTMQWVITARTIIEEVSREEDIMPVKFTFTEFADLAQYMDDKSKSVGKFYLPLKYKFGLIKLIITFPSCFCCLVNVL